MVLTFVDVGKDIRKTTLGPDVSFEIIVSISNLRSTDWPKPLHLVPERSEPDGAAPAASVFSNLPPFRLTALRLLGIASDSQTAISEFEGVFRVDPALTADLLLVANSAAYGPRTRIETIKHAITYLGLDRIRALASTVAFSYQVRSAPQSAALKAVWKHSIATAVVAEQIGISTMANSAIYTGGLMHDIGRLGLLIAAGLPYANAMVLEFTDMDEAEAVETAIAGMTHCQAGACLAQAWEFPASLRACIVEHHTEGPPSSDTTDIVQLSCRLADAVGFPEVRRKDLSDPPHLLPQVLATDLELNANRLYDRITAQLDMFR